MNDALKQKTIRRLQIIEGHVRAVQRMVNDDAYCIDVIKQIAAVQSALQKVSQVVLEEHLSTCVIEAVRNPNKEEGERAIREIAEVVDVKRH
jgi:DNA-binding FrmR family transcriptional regulator